MNDMVQLRPAIPADAPRVAHLHVLSWRSAYRGQFSDAYLDGDLLRDRTAVWTERLEHPAPNQTVTVAHDLGALLGFSCVYTGDHPVWGALLDNMHVHPARKGAGVGSALLGEVGQHCHAHTPASGLYLWVLEANEPAQRFYERHGAQRAGAEPWDPPGGGHVRRLRYVWAADQLPHHPA